MSNETSLIQSSSYIIQSAPPVSSCEFRNHLWTNQVCRWIISTTMFQWLSHQGGQQITVTFSTIMAHTEMRRRQIHLLLAAHLAVTVWCVGYWNRLSNFLEPALIFSQSALLAFWVVFSKTGQGLRASGFLFGACLITVLHRYDTFVERSGNAWNISQMITLQYLQVIVFVLVTAGMLHLACHRTMRLDSIGWNANKGVKPQFFLSHLLLAMLFMGVALAACQLRQALNFTYTVPTATQRYKYDFMEMVFVPYINMPVVLVSLWTAFSRSHRVWLTFVSLLLPLALCPIWGYWGGGDHRENMRFAIIITVEAAILLASYWVVRSAEPIAERGVRAASANVAYMRGNASGQ